MFNTNDFIDYLQKENNGNDFSKEILKYIISYGIEHKTTSLDQLAEFLSDIIPFITFDEVIMFCDDSILTNTTRNWKKELINK